MQTINLNMVPGSVMPVINLAQWDEGRTFGLAIYDGAVSADLTGATILISGRKQDQTAFSYGQTDTVKGNYVISTSSNVVTIRNTLQMAAASGDVLATLTIKKSASDESTLNFIIRVQENPLNGVDISETEIPAIIALAEEQVEESEAWAKGTKDDVPVSSSDPQYHNNSKYWSDQAAQYAQGGLNWKGDCTFAQIPTTGMVAGDMWNITNAFTTDSRFKEGAGIQVKAGTNIAWDGTHWDLLATGSPIALPTGGIAGQFIVKRSSTDQDAEWDSGIYQFPTVAAAEAAIAGGTVQNGAIVFVDEIGGGNLSSPGIANMSDVVLTSLQNGQILVYDSTAQKWKNANQPTIDSAISTSSNNAVRNSTIAAALANGRISFAVDGFGYFGYKKDGADTVYRFANGSSISSWVTPPVPIGDQVYHASSGGSGNFGDLAFDHKIIDIDNDVSGGASYDKVLTQACAAGERAIGIGVVVPLNAVAEAHPLSVRFGSFTGLVPEDKGLLSTSDGIWLCSNDNLGVYGQHFWYTAQYEVYLLYYVADQA